jgi:hypothetical protein
LKEIETFDLAESACQRTAHYLRVREIHIAVVFQGKRWRSEMKTIIAALALFTLAASPTFTANQAITPIAELGVTVDGLLMHADRVLRGAEHDMDSPSGQAL